VIRQIDWADRLINEKSLDPTSETEEARAAPKIMEDPFADPKSHIWNALQEVSRLKEVLGMTPKSGQQGNLAIQQVSQPELTAAQTTNERLEAVVQKREGLDRASNILARGVDNLRLQMARGVSYRKDVSMVRKEILVQGIERDAFSSGFRVDCSQRSAGSRRPVPCAVSVKMQTDGQVAVANHVGLQPTLKYLQTQLRSNFQKELFQQLSQEGLLYSGTGARYFVLNSNDKQVKLECGHAGTITIKLHSPGGDEPDEERDTLDLKSYPHP